MPTSDLVYQFGSIPDQRLWVGADSRLSFRITPGALPPDTVLSMLPVDTRVKGEVTFKPETGEFTYKPAIEDHYAFQVVLNAAYFDRQQPRVSEDCIVITPMPTLPSERHIVSDFPREPDRSLYNTINEKELTKKLFNTVKERLTFEVFVSGLDVIFDPGKPGHAFAGYDKGSDDSAGNDTGNNKGRADIEALHISADRLIIRQPMKFPQTNITITARELVIEDKGAIDTTPLSHKVGALDWDKREPNDPAVGEDGADGLKGGDITLHIGTINLPPDDTTKRFILRGGDGQDAGQGEDGEDRSKESWETKSTVLVWNGYLREKRHGTNNAPFVYFYQDSSLPNEPVSEWGSKDGWPPAGGDAIPPGKAGNGGDGGTFFSSVPVAPDIVDTTPGQPGTTASNAKGGGHGKPVPCCKIRVHETPWVTGAIYSDVQIENIPESITDGKSYTAQSGSPGKAGQMTIASQPNNDAWYGAATMAQASRFVKDAYLLNNRDMVREYLDFYLTPNVETLARREQTSGNVTPEEFALQAELVMLRHRLENHLDYFGNPAGWTPLLALQANLRAYDNEVERAMRTLFLAYWVESVKDEKQKAIKGLQNSLDKLEQDTQATVQEVKRLQSNLPDLQGNVDHLKSKISTVNDHLEDVKARLTTQAGNNVQERHLIEFGATALSVVTSIIPYGQPVLMAAGQVVSALITSQYQTSDKTQSKITNALTAAHAAQVEQQAVDIVNAAGPSMTEAKKTAQASAAQIKIVGKNLGSAVNATTTAFQNLNAPQTEIDAELARLAAQDSEFQRITEEIDNLNAEKIEFASQLTAATQAITSGYSRIASNALAVDAFCDEIASGAVVLNPASLHHIEEMRRRATETLTRYQYFLVKSYESMWLKPYEGADYQLDRVFVKIKDLLASSKDGNLSVDQFSALKAIFSDILDGMVRTLLENLRPEYDSTQWLTLSFEDTPDLIKELNEKGETCINLMDLGLLLPAYENLRIADLSIEDTDGIEVAPQDKDKQGTIHLDFTLFGDGTIRSDGKLYVVRHPAISGLGSDGESSLRWGVTYNVKRDHIERTRPSSSFIGLLRYMLKDSSQSSIDDSQMQYLSAPAAWTDLVISKSVTDSREPIDLHSLTVKVRLTYSSAPRNQCILRVTTRDSHMPLINCDKVDLNERADAYGRLYRIFRRGARVTLTVPETYGRYHFSHWEIFNADTLHKEEIYRAQHTFEVNDDLSVECVYVDRTQPRRPALAVGKRARVISGNKGNNLRAEASIESKRLGVIPPGGEFIIIDGPVSTVRYVWWKVDYQGRIGWTVEGADGKYWLEVVGEKPPSGLLVVGGKGRVKAKTAVNLRDQPSVKAKIGGQLKTGDTFDVLAGPAYGDNYTWWKVKSKNGIGWAAEGLPEGELWLERA